VSRFAERPVTIAEWAALLLAASLPAPPQNWALFQE
jgi:hypothetical protein